MKAESPKGFGELLERLEIANVLLTRMDFRVEDGCKIPQPYGAKIGRMQPTYELRDDQLCIVVGFQVTGEAEEKPLFVCRFQFQVVFTHKNRDEIETYLEDEEVRELLLGSQIDKFVWSYLRKAVQQVVLDAGFPPIMLPMYR